MNLDVWFSWYREVLKEFGFNQNDDEKSAKILNDLLEAYNSLDKDEIKIKNKVIVFGAGPSLKRNIIELKDLNLKEFTLIAADGATTALFEENIIPDIIVTDLDGKMDDIIQCNNKGSVLAVHAHGNNIDKVQEFVPKLKNVLGTTQSVPLEKVHNFGGFTDGDRCIFLAVHFGAKFIILAGMDFGKIVTRYSKPDLKDSMDKADEIKIMKLKYAKMLIEWAAENENVDMVTISGGDKLKNIDNVNVNDIANQWII